jgi:hypothetical protein
MPAYSRKLESLAEAVIRYSGYEPTSELYLARNPGALKATSMRHATNAQGYRIFNSFIDGVQALLFDIDLKITGKSWAKLQPTSTLRDLALSYSLEVTTATAWARFLRAALRDQAISGETELQYFTAKEN